ncbi:MAG: CoA transferase [Rhodospirillales bacterium]|nr:CoA transferase [Rhodospirillales bacterium]
MTADFLKGTRVLDLSQYLPGPSATQMLADMGADVIKVEPPQGDPLLAMNPLTGGPDGAPFYKAVNAGKSILRMDLKSEQGRAGLETLLPCADVLLESYRPGVMGRLGLGADVLKSLNPRLIHCALTGYGQQGPKSGEGGHDINYIALSGGLAVSGTSETPVAGWPPAADYTGALNAVNAILAALIRCHKTGQGAYLDIAMADTFMAWQPWGMTGQVQGAAMQRQGNLLNGGAACYRVYGVAGGRFITLGALEPKFWANFCDAVGHPDWVFRQHEPLPQKDLIDEVEALFASQELEHWEGILAAVDCCYQAVLDYDQAAAHPQVKIRKLVHKTADHGQVLWPVHVDGEAPEERHPAQEFNLNQLIKKWQ